MFNKFWYFWIIHTFLLSQKLIFGVIQLLLVRRAERPEGSPLSATARWGTPSPLRLGVGDVTPPFLRSMADFYCGVAAIWDRWFIIWKGASPPPSHRRSPLRGRLSAAACAPYSAGGMDLRRGGDVVRVRLRPRYVAAQRGTSATPWRSGYSDTSSPRSSKLGLVSTANSPGPGSQTSLSLFLYVNVNAFKKAWIS